MLFNSLKFLIFFPTVFIFYLTLPHRHRWIFLLAASYYFYMCWKPGYLILILVSTLTSYYFGIRMSRIKIKARRRYFLFLSLLINLGFLLFFKYFNFFGHSLSIGFEYFNIGIKIPSVKLLLPVGISFYTFQILSYSIDVYRGNKEAEKHLGIFALYVAFFPQLVAGPIERSTRLLPQFHKTHDFDYRRVTDGLKLMTWGFFQKLVIADALAIVVDRIYHNPVDQTGFSLLIATYFFAFQIYCDFSGYSDIARGSAQVLGYDLMSNFKRPYFSQSVSEFWTRWHISLSSWFKDYLYIPLGGNRVSEWRRCLNLLIVFLISGLWHGAAWTFVIWGGLHGIYLVASIWTEGLRKRIITLLRIDRFPVIQRWSKIFITFHLILIAWIFFRANSVSDSLYIIRHLFTGGGLGFLNEIDLSKMLKIRVAFAVIAVLFMELVHLFQRNHQIRHFISEKPTWFRWAIYYIAIMSIFLFGEFSAQQFIYFQF